MANHYSYNPKNVDTTVKARAVDVRTRFKNMREVCAAVKGMTLIRAKKYLNNVLQKKEIVPFRRFTGKCGRKAQCHNWKVCCCLLFSTDTLFDRQQMPHESILFFLTTALHPGSLADSQLRGPS